MKRRVLLASLAILLCAAATARAQEASSDGVGRVTVEEFKALLASNAPPFVIDVRPGAARLIKGAVNITLDEMDSGARLAEIPRDREIVTYCA